MKPPEALQKVLIFLSRLTPKAKLVPAKDLGDLAFRDAQKRKLASLSIILYYYKLITVSQTSEITSVITISGRLQCHKLL